MSHPIVIPLGFRLLVATAAAVAGMLGFGLAKAANASNREEEKTPEQKK